MADPDLQRRRQQNWKGKRLRGGNQLGGNNENNLGGNKQKNQNNVGLNTQKNKDSLGGNTRKNEDKVGGSTQKSEENLGGNTQKSEENNLGGNTQKNEENNLGGNAQKSEENLGFKKDKKPVPLEVAAANKSHQESKQTRQIEMHTRKRSQAIKIV